MDKARERSGDDVEEAGPDIKKLKGGENINLDMSNLTIHELMQLNIQLKHLVEASKEKRKSLQQMQQMFEEKNKHLLREKYDFSLAAFFRNMHTRNWSVQRVATNESSHTSTHNSVSCAMYDFATIRFEMSESNEEIIYDNGEPIRSNFFNTRSEFLPAIQFGSLKFSSESDIKHYVKTFLSDVLNLCGLPTGAAVNTEISVYSLGATLRPDNLVISVNGHPICIFEVKQNQDPNLLNDSRVLGQAHSYCTAMKNYFGSPFICCIITNLTTWRVCWLPEANSLYARAPPLQQANINLDVNVAYAGDTQSDLHLEDSISNSSSISCSPIYGKDSRVLISVLMTAILKGNSNTFNPLPAFATNRDYIEILENKWKWSRVLKFTKSRFTFQISAPLSNLFIIRHFASGGGDGRAFLVMETTQNFVGVLKKFGDRRSIMFVDVVNRNKEHANWKDIWGVETYPLNAMDGLALLMPLVFTPSRSGEPSNFNFSAAHWAYSDLSISFKALKSRICQELEESVMENFDAGKYEVNQVRQQALDVLDSKSIVHDDVKNDHVGLLPIWQDGRVVELKPVLIDLCRVTRKFE